MPAKTPTGGSGRHGHATTSAKPDQGRQERQPLGAGGELFTERGNMEGLVMKNSADFLLPCVVNKS